MSNSAQPTATASCPFEDKNAMSSRQLFLGFVNKRYIRTVHGMVHGVGSLLALILGNYIFAAKLIVGVDPTYFEKANVVFHLSNFIAALVTMLFFWRRVQSWQLSTTSMKEKGLTPKILRHFNQGRGVLSMALFSVYPLACGLLPQSLLCNNAFSFVFAVILMATAIKIYLLVKDYNAGLFVLYGATPMLLGVSIISSGSIASLNQSHPQLLDWMHNEAVYMISCVQMGFMLYYLYSRKLIAKSTVQDICKRYHVTVSCLYFARMQYDAWWVILPFPLSVQPFAITAAAFGLFLFKVLLPFYTDYAIVLRSPGVPTTVATSEGREVKRRSLSVRMESLGR